MKHRNVILTATSFIMTLAFGAAVGWGTFKAQNILSDKGYDLKSKLKRSWKWYVPAAVFGSLSLTSIGLNSYLSYKDVAALGGAAAFAFKNRNFLEGKLRKNVSKEDLNKLKAKFIGENLPKNLSSVEKTGNGDLLVLDGYSGRWFRSSKEAVEQAEKKLNDKYMTDCCCNYNDFYYFLNISEDQFGWQFEWVNPENWYTEKDGEILFENVPIDSDEIGNESGEDMLLINLFTYPTDKQMEEEV